VRHGLAELTAWSNIYRPMVIWPLPLAFLFLLLLPSARLHVFDGLPVSGLAEFAAFFLILPLCVSRALRRVYARPLQSRRGARGMTPVAAALLLAIGAKLLLLAFGGQPGFAACYQSVLDPNQASPSCERSYENLFFRGGMTRIDDTIAFDPATWNLSFFNSLRFNFFPWIKGNVERTRLPFAAHWRGKLDVPVPTTIALSYVGEGTLQLEGLAAMPLPPAYRRPETIALTVPDGRRAFALDYRFDDGSRVGDGPAILRGPYASMHVRVGTTPLRTVAPPSVWRVVGGFVDLTMIVILGSIVWCYGRLLGRDAGLAAIACVGGALLAIDPTVTMRSVPFLDYAHPEAARGLPAGIGLTLVVGALFVLIARRPSTRLLLLAYLAIGWASVFRQDFLLRGFQTVFYRAAGDDWLTYESYARSILETGSLEAGERIFYHQPLFRYLVFLAHAILGDGDTLIALFAQALLIWSVFWMSASLLPRGLVRGRWRVLGIAVGLLLVVLATSEPVSRLIYVGASEYPTWIVFLMLFPRLCVSRARRDWWLGTMMLGLSLITRMNQAIALGWLFAIFLRRAAFARPRFAVQPILLLAATAALPTAHNVYYGRELSVLPSEHAVTRTLPMPPSRWLRISDDDEAAAQAWTQVGAVTYTSRIGLGTPFVPTVASHAVLLVACRGLQVMWGLAAILLFGARASTTARLLLIVPVLYLSVHLFYQVSDYHPRFIVIGYLAMGAVAMLAVRERATSRRHPPDCPRS
jgi:hypothetical protein